MNPPRIVLSFARAAASDRDSLLARARQSSFRAFACGSGPRPKPSWGEQWFRQIRGAFVAIGPGVAPRPIPYRLVRTPKELDEALGRGRTSGAVAVRWTSDRVIPLENALSRRTRGTEVWVVTDAPEDVPAALGALEVGADRIVVEVATTEAIDRLNELLEGPALGRLRWSTAPVLRVEAAGVSERVLVDTSSWLGPKEGLLVGSSAATLFHIASEAEGSAFSRPRPFRVNAGSLHLYVLMADGTTRYLSELGPGDRLAAVLPGGAARSVRVGRIKIERRPMLLVAARSAATEATVFVQSAETVRLTTTRGRIAAPSLHLGDRLRAVRLPRGRHLGVVVEESIEER